ncbi:hypothetical protein [Rhodovastum atsumiense]|uniref:Uncharacterized protein n=1 Tax=Rhodovastum atsumiense TaxID=504468 RepID=A0A5M6IUM7_9PROT|nr:hypothetical protein [Rhodovastum atsumiense]KAA5611567.1 hypothetical protein F1189_13460 [Rhodovastum atsumiense]
MVGQFTIPVDVPVGSKLVKFQGRGGSKASATFVGRGKISVTELRAVQNIRTTTTEFFERYDPQAETFTLNSPALISGCDVWFCAKGTTGRTFAEIRTCENGWPTSEVVANAVVQTSTLLTDQWYRFSWPPVRLEAGREYALVIGCDDATTAISVAELGKFDVAAQQWVTSQPYQIGVRLSSSNGSTWTAHQDSDLAFRLLRTPTASNNTRINLPDVTITQADELMVLAAIERPTALCDCVFELTLPDASVVTVGEGEIVLLPSQMTGTVKWAAVLSGEPDATPRLHKDIQLVSARRSNTGDYVSRAMVAGSGSRIVVTFEALLPGTSNLTIEIGEDGDGPWTTVPFISATPIGDGWMDRTHRITGYNPATAVVRLTVNGDARQRPEVRKLKAVVAT